MAPIVADKPVKFRDPGWNRRMQHFRRFFRHNFRPEVVNDVISCVAVEFVGVDVRVTFGDSRSNGSPDIRLPHFVTDERLRTTPAD